MAKLRFVVVCLAILGQPVPAAWAVDAAGSVVFAKGEVSALDANETSRYLIRGDKVFSGDTIVTGDGRAQIKFTDGGFASIRSRTEYSLSQYSYRGAADGSERGFFRLIKGGVRFVTGAIGKANRKHFRLSTRTATIGIRGSSGLAEQCENGSCPNRADGTYLTTYNGILTLLSGPFSGEVYPREMYFCDGEGCSKIADHEAPQGPNPVVPDFNQRYREGDQQIHIEPSSPVLETPETFPSSPGIGAPGPGPSRSP